MNIFKEYMEYIKDNPEGYWFKRKLYGWGWTPARWEGWVAVLLYLAAVIFFVYRLDESSSGMDVMFGFILPVGLLTLVLFRISYLMGEKPKWQWGKEKGDE